MDEEIIIDNFTLISDALKDIEGEESEDEDE